MIYDIGEFAIQVGIGRFIPYRVDIDPESNTVAIHVKVPPGERDQRCPE